MGGSIKSCHRSGKDLTSQDDNRRDDVNESRPLLALRADGMAAPGGPVKRVHVDFAAGVLVTNPCLSPSGSPAAERVRVLWSMRALMLSNNSACRGVLASENEHACLGAPPSRQSRLFSEILRPISLKRPGFKHPPVEATRIPPGNQC